ncbi:MAG: N-acetylmannosamine-6-phosphate 2-epimerase [Cyanobacteria bacterium P01_A01_bin.135]
MHPSLSAIRHGLVVSCQAPATSPLHDAEIIAAIAQAAVNQGAVGVRIDSPAHIQATRQRVTVPIIGLWKQTLPDSEVYITPQAHHAVAVAEAGADIIAIDATQRPRPGGETVAELVQRIHTLGRPVMADVDTLAAAAAAVEAGADLVGTTLYGYTAETAGQKPPGFALLKQLVDLGVPAICEGGIASPEMAQKAIALGAYSVVVGTAITGIDALAASYAAALAQVEKS